jgi:hypothetical protein
MSKEGFEHLIQRVTANISSDNITVDLADELNKKFPPDSGEFKAIQAACHRAIEDGWMCDREQGGIKFGRVLKDVDGFSVDVVQMKDLVGPHHRHPNGEVDMIMPISADAKFDGAGAGWVVYGPDSAHKPTVTDGEALILYLLPGGAIEFTGE